MSKLQTLAAVALTALALAACGGAASTESTSPTAAPSASTATAAPTVAAAPTAPVVESAAEATGEAPAASASTAADPAAEAPATSASATADAAVETPAASAADVAAPAKLNLNAATAEELLATIPGFGDRMVREFMEYRPYASIQQFRREIGKYVDEAQVAEYEKYVYVPVDVDAADAETLMQLPGVDSTIAAALMAGRPYGSPEAFRARLAESVSAADAAAAAAYLAAP